MAIGFRSIATAVTSSTTTSITVGKPSGVVADDVLVAIINVGTGSSVIIVAPSGWTLVRTTGLTGSIDPTIRVYSKVATGSEPASYQWSWSGSKGATGAILVFTGVDTTTPVDVHAGTATTSNPAAYVAPSVTTTVSGTMLICAWLTEGSAGNNSVPASMVERCDIFGAGLYGIVTWIGTELIGSAGATGTRTATAVNTGKYGATTSLALRPGLNPVSKALGTVWNVTSLDSVGKSLGTVWSARASVSKSPQALWNVRTTVNEAHQIVWNTKKTVTKPTQALWSLRVNVGKASQRLWNARVATSKPLGTIWKVAITPVSKFITATWNLQETPPPVQVFVPTFTNIQDIISKSHKKTARIVIYDQINGKEIYSSSDLLVPGGLISGGVNFGNSLVRRRASLAFIDRDGTLTPSDADDIFTTYGHVLKVFRGVEIDGVSYDFPLGAFSLSDVSIDDSGPGVRISIECYDYGDVLGRRGLVQDYSVAKGTNFGDAIQVLLSRQLPGIEFNFESTSYTTPALFFQTTQNPWEAAVMMAKSIGCDLYFNPNGVCTMRTVPDYSAASVGFHYEEGEAATALYVNKRYTNRDAYNYFIVTGTHSGNATTGGGGPIRGDAYDDNPNSKTYWKGPFGTVPAPPVSSKLITTQGQADQAARGLLQNSIGRAERLHFNAIVNPLHEVGDVIQFTRAKSKINDRYVIESGYIPLGHDQPMDLTTRVRQGVM